MLEASKNRSSSPISSSEEHEKGDSIEKKRSSHTWKTSYSKYENEKRRYDGHSNSLHNDHKSDDDSDGKEENQEKRIKVTNLTPNVNHNHLMEIFKNYGVISNIDMPKRKYHSFLHAGHAVIEYSSPKDAENAKNFMDGGMIDATEVKIDFYKESNEIEEKSERYNRKHDKGDGNSFGAYRKDRQNGKNKDRRKDSSDNERRPTPPPHIYANNSDDDDSMQGKKTNGTKKDSKEKNGRDNNKSKERSRKRATSSLSSLSSYGSSSSSPNRSNGRRK
ncbi:hypothetical protein SNEBB_001933 [Seison nebaliae]|nr:hypothetical protein SNEBB_001933 [Seison nebaliae]